MLRSQSNESIPDQHDSQHIGPRHDVPCAVYNIDTRWPSAASVPVDSDSPCEVVPWLEDRVVRRENTCRGAALRIACLDGLVGEEVESPSRQVLMENFRNQVEEDPLRAYVSKEREERRRKMALMADVEVLTR